MTEQDYFDALDAVLHVHLKDAVNKTGTSYVIQEKTQKPFELAINGLNTHKGIKPDAVSTPWHCFSNQHPYAQLRSDRVIVSWDVAQHCPKYLLIELKTGNPNAAHKQLGATLAFCHFIHQMVCVGQAAPPIPRFAAITVWNFPGALKNLSTPKLPVWSAQSIQPDCKHMHYQRSQGSLPVKTVMASY